MNTQLIIDMISINLCTKRLQTIVIFGNTVREAESFMRSIAERIPNYVGLQRTTLGRFETAGKTRIRCIASVNSACGMSISGLFVLASVKPAERERICTILYPVCKPVFEE